MSPTRHPREGGGMSPLVVIPAKAGIQCFPSAVVRRKADALDARLRGHGGDDMTERVVRT